MTKAGDNFVAEDFLRATKGDVALWTSASLIVIAGLIGGYWAYSTYAPVEDVAGPPAGAMVVEFADFAVSPMTEELDVAEAELSAASEATPPSEAEPEPEAEPVEEPEPVVEPEEVEPEEVVEPQEVVQQEEVVEPEEVLEPETPPEEVVEPEPEPEPQVEPPPEPEPEPEPLPEPEPAPVPEPVEPIIDVPEIEVPEPAVVVPRRMAAVFPPLPEPVVEPEPLPEPVVEEVVEPIPEPEPPPPEPEPEPVVEPIDPALPMPVAMPQRIAEVRADTPPTVFTPPVRRVPPPQQPASQAAAPKPAAQQAEQAAAPQQTLSAEPSASELRSWQNSVLRHLAQRKRNPNDGRRRAQGGVVVVEFGLDSAGRVLSVNIVQSSGSTVLDTAARELVLSSSPMPAPPAGWKGVVMIPLDYK